MRRLRALEQVLPKQHRFRRCRRVEGDDLLERARRYGLRRGGEVSVEIALQLGEQDRELVIAELFHASRLFRDLDNLRTRRAQLLKRRFEAFVHAGMEASHETQHADAFALQRIGVERGNIIDAPCIGLRRRRIVRIAAGDDAQHRGDISHAAAHRPRRVLTMADRHDVRTRDEAHCGLDPNQTIDGRWANDRAIRLGADGDRRKAGGRRRAGAGRGAAGVAVERIGIARQAADRAPATGRCAGANVGPLGEIGLAEDDRAGFAQPRHQRRIAVRHVLRQRQRTGGRGVLDVLDVVLEQHRNAVQRPAHIAGAALLIERARLFERLRVQRKHAVDGVASIVDLGDAVEIRLHQLLAGHRTGGQIRLQLGDGFFFDVIACRALRFSARRQHQRRDRRHKYPHRSLRLQKSEPAKWPGWMSRGLRRSTIRCQHLRERV